MSRRLASGDSARSVRLEEIVADHGWPDRAVAGEEAADAAFLVLQHSPNRSFQKRMMPEIEKLATDGRVSSRQAALLIDRVRMHEGRPQKYGTQFERKNARFVLYRVEGEDGLDERRAEMDLPSMDEYVRMLEEAYGMPVEREP